MRVESKSDNSYDISVRYTEWPNWVLIVTSHANGSTNAMLFNRGDCVANVTVFKDGSTLWSSDEINCMPAPSELIMEMFLRLYRD